MYFVMLLAAADFALVTRANNVSQPDIIWVEGHERTYTKPAQWN